MSKKQDLERLLAKIEVISEAKQRASDAAEMLKNDVIRLSGGSAGAKEMTKLSTEFMSIAQREFQLMIQEGKISSGVSDFCSSFLNRLQATLTGKELDIDRAHYAKMGELKALEAQIESFSRLINSLEVSRHDLELVIDAEKLVEEESVIVEAETTGPLVEQASVAEQIAEPPKKQKKIGRQKKVKQPAKKEAEPIEPKPAAEKASKNTFDTVWKNVLNMKKGNVK